GGADFVDVDRRLRPAGVAQGRVEPAGEDEPLAGGGEAFVHEEDRGRRRRAAGRAEPQFVEQRRIPHHRAAVRKLYPFVVRLREQRVKGGDVDRVVVVNDLRRRWGKVQAPSLEEEQPRLTRVDIDVAPLDER